LLFTTTSCNESEECYSCDPAIDSWAKENKLQIINFERTEIATYSHAKQKAILAVLSPERKKILWQEKMNHILTLDLPKEEIIYLKWYAEVSKSFNYKEPTSKELSKEMYEKTIKGMDQFGWSRKFVYQAFFILGNVDSNIEETQSLLRPVDEEVACDCMYSMGCGLVSGSCNKYVECSEKESNDDCGFLGNSECDGICA